MRLRLTRPAASQLDRVLAYLAERNPQGSRRVQKRIKAALDLLVDNPHAGLLTARPGIRRMLVPPYPYVIFYRIGDGEIIIDGVRHTARRPVSR